MSPKYLILIPISILTIHLFTACSDDPAIPEPDSDILLTLHLNEYSLGGYPSDDIVSGQGVKKNLASSIT